MLQDSIGNRYLLQSELGAGGMGAVYRATDRLTGQTVAVKRVTVKGDQADSLGNDFRLALSQEFRTLASLRHPHVITVLDYGFDSQQRPYFTMPLLEDARTITAAAQDAALPDKVHLLAEMLQALAYLHRRGIVHRDLKPDNVLVDAGGQVKVLDFGLSVVAAHSSVNLEGQIVGTLAYIAPEILLEQPASAASDLYSAGVIACQIFQGRLPYSAGNIGVLINKIINSPPDLTAVPDPLAAVLERLLAKDPSARQPFAEVVIEAICLAAGQPAPVENVAVRESFLQAAEFVGRDHEMRQLGAGLAALSANGDPSPAGSAWLVGGESGVGKSRLLEELRIRALVGGVTVLRGQASAEGGLPYQVWRDVVRRLVLSTPVDDTDAAILKELLPDIAAFLERSIPDVPPIEGASGQRRLIGTIISLFRRQTTPTLLLLEDLQWAQESLQPLRALLAIVRELPLMIVANYRDDERANLPNELPVMTMIHLQRLPRESIARLSAAMLGQQGRDPYVLEFLQRETEGNAFFLVEVVRALAEEAGRLSDVGRATLPARAFAGGMQAIIRWRLASVPYRARARLKLAAVAGRQLDLAVLRAIPESEPQPDMDTWLTMCSNAVVLETADGNWRFSHDKLREALLNDLSEEERRALHWQVAEGIESVYPDSPAQAAVLAGHWREAGNVEREIRALEMALKESQRVQVHADTLAYGKRLIELLSPEDVQAVTAVKVEIIMAYDSVQQYDRALPLIEECLEVARREGLTAIEGRLFQLRGGIKWQQGDLDSAMADLQQSLTIAQSLNDLKILGRTYLTMGTIHFIREEYDQAINYYRQAHETLLDASPSGAAGTLMNWGVIYEKQGKISAALNNYDQALSAFRTLGDRYGQGLSLANIGLAYFKLGQFDRSRDYLAQYQAIARDLGSPMHEAMAAANLASNALHLGNYALAQTYIDRVFETRQRLGDYYYTPADLDNAGLLRLLQGDRQGAADYFRQSAQVADKMHSTAVMDMARGHLALIDLLDNRLDDALRVLEEARQVGHNASYVRHLRAITLARSGQTEEARTEIASVLAEAETELAQTPDLWSSQYNRAQALMLLALLAAVSGEGEERESGSRRAMEAYRAAYGEAFARGVVASELLIVEAMQPLDQTGLLDAVRAVLDGH